MNRNIPVQRPPADSASVLQQLVRLFPDHAVALLGVKQKLSTSNAVRQPSAPFDSNATQKGLGANADWVGPTSHDPSFQQRFWTPPPTNALDRIDEATLRAIDDAQKEQWSKGNREPSGFTRQTPEGELLTPHDFGTEGSGNSGYAVDESGNYAISGWHGHGPFPNQSAYSLSNRQNFAPSKGDRTSAYPGANQELQDQGKLEKDRELRQYVIMPDGGIRRYDDPIKDPSKWVPIAPSGYYKWRPPGG